MEFILTKDWGIHKKGSKVFITDKAVIKVATEKGLFQEKIKTKK